MRVPLRSRPKTLAQRAEAVGSDAVDLVRKVPDLLDTSRKRALAVAGGAASFAAGFAVWRARGDDGPSVHADPAQPAPWKMTPPSEASTSGR